MRFTLLPAASVLFQYASARTIEYNHIKGNDGEFETYSTADTPYSPGADKVANIPYILDSRRESDGVSSTSPFTYTSPSFPLYLGEEAEVKQRKGRDIRPVSSKGNDFAVQSAVEWNPSLLSVQEGYEYEIVVDPLRSVWKDGKMVTDAGGYDSFYDAISDCFVAQDRCRSHLRHTRRLPKYDWFALICAIGDFTYELQVADFDKNHYMPLREEDLVATSFPVGMGTNFTSPVSGELVCYANDAFGLYWNNDGSVTATARLLTYIPVVLTEDEYRELNNITDAPTLSPTPPTTSPTAGPTAYPTPGVDIL